MKQREGSQGSTPGTHFQSADQRHPVHLLCGVPLFQTQLPQHQVREYCHQDGCRPGRLLPTFSYSFPHMHASHRPDSWSCGQMTAATADTAVPSSVCCEEWPPSPSSQVSSHSVQPTEGKELGTVTLRMWQAAHSNQSEARFSRTLLYSKYALLSHLTFLAQTPIHKTPH